jgi:flavodoxin
MKTMVVSYSLSGNNEALAASLAAALNAEQVRITESKSRTMITIVLDMLFHRTPKIHMSAETIEGYDLVLFVGPVWMGQIATPFRACFKELGPKIGNYGFISISGGAEGPNPKLAAELQKRLGRAPVCLIDLHLADLLPAEPAPARKDTMGYRLNAREVEALTERVVGALQESVADSIPARVEVIA